MSEDEVLVFIPAAGGGLYAIGTKGSISGRGAALLLLDDPIHDSLSQTEKDATWTWYQEVAVPRLDPGGRTLIVAARLCSDDLIGRILESDDRDSYDFITLPMLAEADDPIGRLNGAPLWPDRLGLEEIEERRVSMGSYAFTAQFLQRPEAAGLSRVFRPGWFGRYQQIATPNIRPYNPLDRFVTSAFADAYPKPEDFITLTALDAAGKLTASGSYSALCTLITDGRDVYVVEVERARVDYDGLRGMVVAHVQRWQPDCLLVENEGMGSRIIGSLEASSFTDPSPRSGEGKDRARLFGGAVV